MKYFKRLNVLVVAYVAKTKAEIVEYRAKPVETTMQHKG